MGKLSQYRLKQCAGGSQGIVYRAHLKSDPSKLFAVKERLPSSSSVEREIKREIEALEIINKVNHPNLLGMVDWFVEHGRYYIVMPYAAGGSLLDELCNNPKKDYTEQDICLVLAKVSSALKALHDIGYCHNDVKLENLLLLQPGDLKTVVVCDFGFMRKTEHPFKGVVGSPVYISPEVYTKCQYSPANDTWALGIVLFCLLGGYTPFRGDGTGRFSISLEHEVCYKSPPFYEQQWAPISAEARDIVTRLLVKDPKKRITLDKVLVHKWVSGTAPRTHLPATVKALLKMRAKARFRAIAYALVVGSYHGRLKNLEQLVLGTSFASDEIRRIRDAFFHVVEPKGSVYVSKDNFAKVMNELGYGKLPLDSVFNVFDRMGDGSSDNMVDYREFLVGLTVLKQGTKSAIELCFDIYDKDKNGVISLSEFANVLETVAQEDIEKEQEKAAALAAMFQRIDVDKDGSISFEEFEKACKTEPLLTRAFLSPLQSLGGSSEDVTSESAPPKEPSPEKTPIPKASASESKEA